MSLVDWERNGWLTAHRTSQNEIRDLLEVVERDLTDSAAENLSADWRMNIAYNAALQAATAALAAAGFRASSITTESSSRFARPLELTLRWSIPSMPFARSATGNVSVTRGKAPSAAVSGRLYFFVAGGRMLEPPRGGFARAWGLTDC